MSTRLLNQAQAESIFSAMQLLNSIGAHVRVDLNDGDLSVQQHHKSGKVTVTSLERLPIGRDFESYDDQAAFAAAYGLQEQQSANKAAVRPPYWNPSHFHHGQRVKYGEHEAVIERHYHEGMWDIRLPGGPACVSGANLVPV